MPEDKVELEKQYFTRGKAVLGNNAGGMLAQLLKAKNGSLELARAAVETASTKENAREYIGRIVHQSSPTGTNGHAYAASWNYAAEQQRKAAQSLVTTDERKRVGEKMQRLASKLHGKAGEPDRTPLAELERLAELSAERDEILGR